MTASLKPQQMVFAALIARYTLPAVRCCQLNRAARGGRGKGGLDMSR